MHELSLVEAILDSLLPMCSEYGIGGKVRSVRLRIGRMRQVIPDVMRFAYEVATENTTLSGSTLEITVIPLRFSCPACGAEWEGQEAIAFVCPKCGGRDVTTHSGMELEIESMEVEQHDEPSHNDSTVRDGSGRGDSPKDP
jgi:hydrogenase nickel incorporation protein HypA/HybF